MGFCGPVRWISQDRFFSERCFFCSKHGRFDTSESGIRNVARLVLQHGDGSEFRGASGAGSKLYSVHRGLPASARFVKRYFSLMGWKLQPTSLFALPKPANWILVPASSHFSEVGRSRQVQGEHHQTVLISPSSASPASPLQSSTPAQMIPWGFHRFTRRV